MHRLQFLKFQGALMVVLILTLVANMIDIPRNSFGQQLGESFDIAAVGDIGCGRNGEQTISSIERSVSDLTILLGDLAYRDDLSCFFTQTQALEAMENSSVMLAIGNHEIGSNDGNENTKQQLMDHYDIPKEGYYSKTFGNNDILVVAMNFTGLERGNDLSKNNLENLQYEFVKDTIENSNASYKIVASHAPFVSINCDEVMERHQNEPCHSPLEDWDNDLFQKYHTLFEETGVDIVLSGHNHNYQREQEDGVNYIINGLGGARQYEVIEEDNTHFADEFGFLHLTIMNDSINGEFIPNDSGNTKDNFVIDIEKR